MEFKTFEYTEHKLQDMENEIDPENTFYNSSHNQCEYYTEEQFKMNVKMGGGISIIHFNSSLNTNFSNIKYCLKELDKKFTVIAIS